MKQVKEWKRRHASYSFAIIMLAVGGCSVTFPQVDALLSQFGSSDPAALTVPQDAIWLATFENQGQLLAAYQREGFILFANADSNGRVEFDGWLIRKVSGFDSEDSGTIVIASDGNAGPRAIARGITATTMDCGDWLWSPDEGLSGAWQQSCDGVEPNMIMLNEEGSIVVIDQVVAPSGERLKLQRYDSTSR